VTTTHAQLLIDRPEYLRERLKALPDSPGVYLFRDLPARVIYVGKALNLAHRVPAYFQGTPMEPPRLQALVDKIFDFEFIATANEKEALILECTLIKRYRPRYNIRLRDDKNYLYAKVPVGEDFGRVYTVRRTARDGAKYYGPYTNAQALRGTLKALRRIFPYRTCSDDEFKLHRPCLDYHLKLCPAPCAGFITAPDYRALLDQVALFLEGRSAALTDRLREQMQAASAALQFEAAARYRDRLHALEEVVERQKMLTRVRTDQDWIGIARADGQAMAQVFLVREGKLVGSEQVQLEGAGGSTDAEILSSFLAQFYGSATHVPREIFLPEALPDQGVLEEWLSERRGAAVAVRIPQRGDNRALLELVERNAAEALRQLKIKWDFDANRTETLLADLQQQLQLPGPPRRIECYDISNLQGQSAVGSMVVFEDGRPKPAHYRHFRIKTVAGANDYAMLQETLRRRFARNLSARAEGRTPAPDDSFAVLPDLLLVDGGKGQLSAACAVLDDAGLGALPAFGLAKRQEELFAPDDREPIRLPLGSASLFLVQRVRDEAHRFAVTFHRNVHKASTLRSALDGVPGVGPARRRALLKTFGSVEGIRRASLDELLRVRGVTRRTAVALKELL
jgi:excinuclease ABC subunit C